MKTKAYSHILKPAALSLLFTLMVHVTSAQYVGVFKYSPSEKELKKHHNTYTFDIPETIRAETDIQKVVSGGSTHRIHFHKLKEGKAKETDLLTKNKIPLSCNTKDDNYSFNSEVNIAAEGDKIMIYNINTDEETNFLKLVESYIDIKIIKPYILLGWSLSNQSVSPLLGSVPKDIGLLLQQALTNDVTLTHALEAQTLLKQMDSVIFPTSTQFAITPTTNHLYACISILIPPSDESDATIYIIKLDKHAWDAMVENSQDI
jgi:hypothetical protein